MQGTSVSSMNARQIRYKYARIKKKRREKATTQAKKRRELTEVKKKNMNTYKQLLAKDDVINLYSNDNCVEASEELLGVDLSCIKDL